MNASEEQENEILVLNSILDAENINFYKIRCGENNKSIEQNAGRFIIDIDLPEPLKIEVKIKDVHKSADISHLPPIYCSFILPKNYPLECSPEIDLVAIWLSVSTGTKLNERFAEICQENYQLPVLYLFHQCIKDEISEFLEKPLNLNSCKLAKPRRTSLHSTSADAIQQNANGSKTTSVVAPHYTPEQLFDVLIDYNRLRKRKLFEKNVFVCQICYAQCYGAECVQFSPCEHIFCRACCRDYFTLNIGDGTLAALTCMATECDSQATPHMIRDIVDEATYERYERLTLTRSLDMMRDVVLCPRPTCRSFVVLDADDPKMGWCSVCTFAFCTLCNKVYHGVAPCSITINDVNTVVEQYNRGDEEIRRQLDERYGKGTIKRLVEDASSLKWQKENCQECPCCRSPIEKKDGCNKMWCSKCGSYFCWLCLRSLPKDNPYNHFNDPNSTCFNALFRGVRVPDSDDDDDDDDNEDDGW